MKRIYELIENAESFNELVMPIIKLYYKNIMGNHGDYILDEGWDNLIILDACRYDTFKKYNNILGDLEFRYSRGGGTREFLKENFKEEYYPDIVYVTGNPYVTISIESEFYRMISVWDEYWNHDYDTVLPDVMAEQTIKARNKFPEKRIISHFVQPHYPFIGDWARENLGSHQGMISRYNIKSEDSKSHGKQMIWNLLKNNEVDKETIKRAYEENLKLTLPHVKNMIKKLNGKTIITSDHGNLFGKWLFPFPIKGYGHPTGIYHEELIKVPWLVIKNGEKDPKNEKEMIKNSIESLDI